MSKHAGAVSELVEQLGRLPGIGRKSAERLAFHLLRVPEAEAMALADAVKRVRNDVRYCDTCFNLAETNTCTICADPSRDPTRLCIVEQPRDLMSLEQSGVFKGYYHVLLGRIAPLRWHWPRPVNRRCIGRSCSHGQFCGSDHGHQPNCRRGWNLPLYLEFAKRISCGNHAFSQRNHGWKCPRVRKSRNDCGRPHRTPETIIFAGGIRSPKLP